LNGTFDCKKGRVFVSYKEKQGALNVLETMLITKEYHLQQGKTSISCNNDRSGCTNTAQAQIAPRPHAQASKQRHHSQ